MKGTRLPAGELKAVTGCELIISSEETGLIIQTRFYPPRKSQKAFVSSTDSFWTCDGDAESRRCAHRAELQYSSSLCD